MMSSEATQILLINQHEMFTEIMQRVFDAETDMAVIGHTNGCGAVKAVEHSAPDVVVLDYDIDNGRGAVIAREIRDHNPATKVVMLLGAPNVAMIREVISAGCLGVVSKDRGANDLLGAVRTVARGHSVAAVPQLDAMLEPIVEDTDEPLLTARQSDVLQLMGQGLSTDALAAALFVSRNTIRSHVHQILVKLEAKSKLEAVVNARRSGLIS